MRDPAAFAHEHIGYEVEMLVETAVLLGELRADTVTHDAVLESFLVHARLLDGFLAHRHPEEEDPNADDVFAVDYAPEWDPRHFMPGQERAIANKQVAHLTWRRQIKQKTRVRQVRTELASGLEAFLALLPPEQRAWFDRAQRALATRQPSGVIATTTTSYSEVHVVTWDQLRRR